MSTTQTMYTVRRGEQVSPQLVGEADVVDFLEAAGATEGEIASILHGVPAEIDGAVMVFTRAE